MRYESSMRHLLALEVEGARRPRICRQPLQTGGTTEEMDCPLEAAGRIWPSQRLDFDPNTHFRPLASSIVRKTSLVAQMVKHPPTMRETRVQSLGRENLLKKGMATHSSILAPHTHKKGGLKKYFGLPWWLRC